MHARPNCQHLDNHRNCRVHRPYWIVTALIPNYRPPCILDRAYPPRDGEWTCADQKAASARPAGPPPQPP